MMVVYLTEPAGKRWTAALTEASAAATTYPTSHALLKHHHHASLRALPALTNFRHHHHWHLRLPHFITSAVTATTRQWLSTLTISLKNVISTFAPLTANFAVRNQLFGAQSHRHQKSTQLT